MQAINRFASRILICVCWLASFVAFASEPVDYSRDIQPVFAQQCLDCHGPDKQESGFRIDLREAVTSDADSGAPPVLPGKAEASELFARITSTDPDTRMPPDGARIAASQVALIRQWINDGANYTEHWAYRPLERTRPPAAETQTWDVNPIDRFVIAKLEAESIAPSPRADRATLIKRLYYDLLGMTPAVDTVKRFVPDESPSAYERLVDEILASPRFGERWGRHWLDAARYADSDGYEKDNTRPNAWYYRDWVINAINADVPFDQFTIEQLAGDLLDNATSQQKLATAFHRQTLTNTEGGTDREQWRVAAVMDRTETLGTVWLGLTVGCARCHNHKYDRISQDEYYQFFAFFNNGDETTFDLPVSLLKREKVRVVTQRTKEPRRTRVLRRGEFLEPLHEVHPGTVQTLPALASRLGDTHTADRLDLARWLVDGQNPLPPRVAANHVWKQLFGEGLVRTPNDFGVRGEPPTHPRLLDWLATELVHSDWSRKALIRTIVLSQSYQQSSKHRADIEAIDPQNRTIHRQNRFRVEAETIRDIALAASGLLSNRIGGPSVFPPIPDSVTDLTYNSGFKWKTSEGDNRFRRGMYTFFKRTAPHPNLITFDCPNSNVTTVDRETSNTPIAALVTLNNAVYVEAARAFARRLLDEFPQSRERHVRQRIEHALRRCLAREPREDEVTRLETLAQESMAFYTSHPGEAAKLVGKPDAEWAAWTAVARVVLNLDEFITRE